MKNSQDNDDEPYLEIMVSEQDFDDVDGGAAVRDSAVGTSSHLLISFFA